MTPDESNEAPFDTETDEPQQDEQLSAAESDPVEPEMDDKDIQAAKKAWKTGEIAPDSEPFAAEESDAESDSAHLSDEDREKLSELAQPFIGQWNNLISTTNWEKGRIISEWRQALIETGLDATQYSDEAWSRRVGGVTAPHVGRLRRVYDRFGSTFKTYDDIYWSHFLAALDWDDAPMWLEGASRESWSVSNMREKRWEENGAVESQRPTKSQVVDVDLDEDITLPAQGGGREKDFSGEEGSVATGPVYEAPDFGDEEELSGSGKPKPESDKDVDQEQTPVQPFVGLPNLPDDMTDAIEDLKLCVLRHKTSGWQDTNAEDVQKYLDAIGVLLRS